MPELLLGRPRQQAPKNLRDSLGDDAGGRPEEVRFEGTERRRVAKLRPPEHVGEDGGQRGDSTAEVLDLGEEGVLERLRQRSELAGEPGSVLDGLEGEPHGDDEGRDRTEAAARRDEPAGFELSFADVPQHRRVEPEHRGDRVHLARGVVVEPDDLEQGHGSEVPARVGLGDGAPEDVVGPLEPRELGEPDGRVVAQRVGQQEAQLRVAVCRPGDEVGDGWLEHRPPHHQLAHRVASERPEYPARLGLGGMSRAGPSVDHHHAPPPLEAFEPLGGGEPLVQAYLVDDEDAPRFRVPAHVDQHWVQAVGGADVQDAVPQLVDVERLDDGPGVADAREPLHHRDERVLGIRARAP